MSIIHISGPSGSGKTTLGNKLKKRFGKQIVVKDLDDLRAEFVKKHLDKDGLFLTVDTSLNLNENSKQPTKVDATLNQYKNSDRGILNAFNLIKILKDLFRPYYYFLFKRHIYQLWGWKRDNYEIKLIFHKNGFSTLRAFSAVGQSFIMFNLKNNS